MEQEKMMDRLKAESKNIEGYIGMLLMSAPIMHMYHFQTSSIAVHIATEKYYKGIVKLTDSLVEAYQGEKGIVNIKLQTPAPNSEPVGYLKALLKIGEAMTGRLSQDVGNINQEITALMKQTIYQLENLS
jgi:hypothetical protein